MDAPRAHVATKDLARVRGPGSGAQDGHQAARAALRVPDTPQKNESGATGAARHCNATIHVAHVVIHLIALPLAEAAARTHEFGHHFATDRGVDRRRSREKT